ncbi:MAG: potassium-transporting ATPase subunit KdpC [Thermodesulfobacteriota bacterium]
MQDLKPAILLVLVLTVLCGGIYPALVTGAAQALFPEQAAGSLIRDQRGQVVGSRLIGQPFADPRHFWPRPSATAPFPYNPEASAGSNLGPNNPAYLRLVAARVEALRQAGVTGAIPADLVQASASGLDPHLSVAAALAQVPRVAKARGLSEDAVRQLVTAHTIDRQWGFLGEPRVTVLLLNLALDGRQ